MSFLLDTNIISDLARRRDAGLLAWAEAQHPTTCHLSVLNLGEIHQGIELLPEQDTRRAKLRAWLQHDLLARFADRVLPVSEPAALAWGELAARGKRSGRSLPVIDGLLLATAVAHGLTLVTRNLPDADERGVPVLNPHNGVRPKP